MSEEKTKRRIYEYLGRRDIPEAYHGEILALVLHERELAVQEILQ